MCCRLATLCFERTFFEIVVIYVKLLLFLIVTSLGTVKAKCTLNVHLLKALTNMSLVSIQCFAMVIALNLMSMLYVSLKTQVK